jgi:ficolin
MKLFPLGVALIVIVGTVATGQQSKYQCVPTWTKSENSYVKRLQGRVAATEEECKSSCHTDPFCWSVDWNFKTNACYYGYFQNPEKFSSSDTNHWDLACTAPFGQDCGDIHINFPSAKSGVYMIILPDRKEPLPVYCDMDTGFGGWTVFQRRKDGSENFQRTWSDYASGFGSLTGEFWLGNEYLADLTKKRTYRLRVDLENSAGVRTSAEYNDFKVGGAVEKYKLTFSRGSYLGNAGDALNTTVVTDNPYGMKFSTTDQDNDQFSKNCADLYHGGWWYNACHQANLNGQYNNVKFGEGVNWVKQYPEDYYKSLKFVEMKMRALDS